MNKRFSYNIDELEAFVEACQNAGLRGNPLAEAIGVSRTAVSRGQAEGMANRAAWREAVVTWTNNLYAKCEASGTAPIYEFEVRGETRFVQLPPRRLVAPPAPAPAAPVVTTEAKDKEPTAETAASGALGVDAEPGAAQQETPVADPPTQEPQEPPSAEVQPEDETPASQLEPEDDLDGEEGEQAEDGVRLTEAVESEVAPESPWGDPDRFAESYVSRRLKEQFDAEFGDQDKDGSEAGEPNWRVDGVPIQPPPDVIERYGLELGRKVWMYRQVCWTAGLVKTHLGLGYSEKTSRLLHRLELELALELMNDYEMTMEEDAEQAWSSETRVEMIELQQKVIAYYDVLMVDLAPGKVLGFGIKCLTWLDSVKNRRKRRQIADNWGLKS